MILWGWALKERSLESAASLGWTADRAEHVTAESRGMTHTFVRERLVSIRCAPFVSLWVTISGFCCFLSFLQRQRRDFLFQQTGSGSTNWKLRGSLIKHQIWWSINSPSADWRSVEIIIRRKRKISCASASVWISPSKKYGYKYSYFLAYQSWQYYQENCIKIKSSQFRHFPWGTRMLIPKSSLLISGKHLEKMLTRFVPDPILV